MRDILHLSNEEIDQMDGGELYDALVYVSMTYTLRRSDLPYREPKEQTKPQRPNTNTYTFIDPRIEAFIAREAIKDSENNRSIPRKSFISIKKGEEKNV